jgi:hypothetical protein
MSSSTRREFLKRLGLAGAALSVPWATTACASPFAARPDRALEISGRITASGRGLADVSVTDGLDVVRTDADGRFTLPSTTRQPFVYLSVPAGYQIPQHDTGTARAFRPLPTEGGQTEVQFDLAPMDQDDTEHAFLALADPQTQTAAEMELFHSETVPDVQATVEALGDTPVFGVGCGDLMFDDLSLFPEYERAVQRMGVPFFQVIGNHDLNFDAPTDYGSARTFRDHFGPTYYSFDRGAVHYVVLDDVYWPGSNGFGSNTDDYLGHINKEQLDWLEQDLSYVEDGRPVVVFVHIPLLSTRFRRLGEDAPSPRGHVANRQALYRLLEPFDGHVIAGHTHEMDHRTEAGPHEHVLGTTCGAWWSGPICYDGTPSGYAVYEVDGTDIQWRYKATGEADDHQMRIYERGADPAAPDEFVANIWDADPEWSVVWYADGERQGPMARRTGTDPLSVELHRGDDKPEKRTWVEPVPTNHLYYAPVADDVDAVRVEATDRFGRTYTETKAL